MAISRKGGGLELSMKKVLLDLMKGMRKAKSVTGSGLAS
jgi:hypothetical protein